MFAKQGNFDPLIADNWYNVTKTDILSIKVCYLKNSNIVIYCKNSIKNNIIN